MRNKLQENNFKKNQKNTLRCSFQKKKRKKKSIFTKRGQEKKRLHSFKKNYTYISAFCCMYS